MNKNFTSLKGCRGIRYREKFKTMIPCCILLLLFFILSNSVFAQGNYLLTGTVADEKGAPLPGASIVVKGTAIGTVSALDGKYAINVSTGQTLVFTIVGYETREEVVKNQRTISVSLTEKTNTMNEVVVVGYGTQKKVSLTNSVASITGSEIVTTKNENVQNMLTGKVAGLRVVQTSSEPGSFSNSFDIRGMGTPLVVIDGIPRDNITRLDPNDIESISVLKDGGAAVYGVRAANGVVLITTKKGKKGTVEFTYSGNYGIQVPSGLPKPVGAVDYMTLVNESLMHNVNGGHIGFTAADIAAYQNGSKQSTDWYTPVIDNHVPQSQHNLSASGGSENTRYFISFGTTDQDGFLRSGDLNYKRYNIRSNISTKVSKNLTVDLNINGTMDQKNQPYQDAWNIFRSYWRQLPTQSIYANNNPSYLNNGQVDGSNPVALADQDVSGYKIYNNKWFQSSVSAVYQVPYVKGLSAKGLFSYDYYMSSNKAYQASYDQYNYDAAINTYNSIANQTPATIRQEFYEKPSTLSQLSLNYDHAFNGGHNISALLLYEESENSGNNFYAQRELTLPVDQLLAGNSLNQQAYTDPTVLYQNANKGLVGRLNYNYNAKYLAEFSFREDGSSKFASSRQWGFFPSASAGWMLSQENFWKNTAALSFIDQFKIRLSFGRLGDDSASSYQFISGYVYPADGSNNLQPGGSVFDQNYINAVASRGIANPNITWYTSNTYNAGIDLVAWKGLLGITFDVFRRDRNGLLATEVLSLPGVVGANLPQENLNSDRTQGFDMEITHKNHIGNFNYNLKGTFGFTRTMNRNVVMAAAGNSYLNWQNNSNNRYTNLTSANNITWGYGGAGRYTSYGDIANSSVAVGRGTVVGDYIYEDWNGDGQINSQDIHPIAYDTTPMITFGLNLGGSYKSFDFNLLFQGAAMVNVVYAEQLTTPLWGGGSALTQFLDRYHPTNPNADPYDPNTQWTAGSFAYTGTTPFSNSSFNIQNGTYVRLKSAEFGYSVPQKLAERIGIKGARLFVNGYNLLTVTGLKYVDPEHNSGNYGYTYPLNKTYSVGVNIKL